MTLAECEDCGRRYDTTVTDHCPECGSECRECGTPLGAGYLCDACDTLEVLCS